jgi:conjugative transfer pilus assembly protein TraH
MLEALSRKEIVKGVAMAILGSVAFSTLQHSGVAEAGMNGVIQGMFSATSSPMAVQTNNGYTLSGGYAVYHTPMSGANVISFSPPNISAGCGGINLYLGSFHFINGQQFLALLREIGQEAIGYAFQLAIDAMCHTCGALLSAIQKAVSDMNNALRNTCQLAQGVFPGDKILQDFQTVGNEAEKTMGDVTGDITDFFDASNNASHEGMLSNIENTYSANLSKSFSFLDANGNTQTSTKSQSEPQTALLPTGNMFWKAINNTEAENMLADVANTEPALDSGNPCKAAGDNACAKEFLMSLVGTEIIHPSASSQGNSNAQAAGMGNGGAVNQANGKNILSEPALITLHDLVDGNSGAEIYQCQGWADSNGSNFSAFDPVMGCQEVTEATMQQLGYDGIKPHVKHMLFGGGPGNHTGLVNEIAGGTLSATQQTFLSGVPAPLYSLLVQASGSGSLMSVVAEKAEPLIVEGYAAKLGEALISTESTVYAGNGHVIIPNGYRSAMNNLQASTRMYEKELNANFMPTYNGLVEMIQKYKASLAAPLRQAS